MSNIIVFDIDKTLVKKNLHELIISNWLGGSYLRRVSYKIVCAIISALPHRSLRRRFEYFVMFLICDHDIQRFTIDIMGDANMVNLRLINRIDRYRRLGIEMVMVTAAPSNVVKHLSLHLNIPVYSSRSIFGFLYSDLLGKKYRIYKLLELQGRKIKSIYSDSPLDFYNLSKNYLVLDNFTLTIAR
ncbi:haloacid dehalogenase-like hydrolase [Propionivibrio dicarboxylicus]|uniref:Haloacid dehalogenase-like hydrolase n=1 Tax=Propionivibrio dicarboxylicus TaxID=83767 RepID=A0A1G8DV61_9RHOO|nr:haloacid dehalogenase-like hydrolase [Propionivibrio dicarboxylicus]